MTIRNANDKHKFIPVEIRIRLDPEDASDLAAIAKISGLATATFCRTILKNYLNRTYAKAGD